MPLHADEPVCPKFQPNIFDPSRCHDCLRQRRLHSGTGESTEDPGSGVKTGSGNGPGKGVPLTPIPSQAEERDTSSKEDSDGVSAASTCCDVSGGCRGYERGSLCILSPDCELYICDDDDGDDASTDSCRDYREFSSSVSAEDCYLPIRRQSAKGGMTRLDPPPHRPDPQTWMDEARSRDTFSRHSGLKDDKRESGYFSLGRAAGARSLREKSPPAPFRHFERGHPIYGGASVEPKDTVPFRNPNLGVASERLIAEVQNEELPVEIVPPDAYDIAVEVEAQVGPRSPSPTPFKIAESLAPPGRKGFRSSYGQGSPSSHALSHPQPGNFNSSRQGSTPQSRFSSAPRGTSPFRRSDLTDGGGWAQRMEPGSRGSLAGTRGRRVDSGTLPRNFKAFDGSVKSQSGALSDFRSAPQRKEVRGPLSGRGGDSRSSSPSRRSFNPPGSMSFHKTDIASNASQGRGLNSRPRSPSGRAVSLHGNPRSSPPRTPNSSGRSFLRKSDSLNGLSRHGRCGSPIREGYDIESQALLRNPTARNELQDKEHENAITSPPRRGYDTRSRGSRDAASRLGPSFSPGRRGYETSPHQLRKTDASSSSLNFPSRNSSPSRRRYEAPSHPPLRETEGSRSARRRDGHGELPSRKSYQAPDPFPGGRSERSSSLSRQKANRHSSPSRAAYSVLRSAPNGDPRKNTYDDSRSGPSRSPSPQSHRSFSSSCAASPTRHTTNGCRATATLDAPRSPSSAQSRAGRPRLQEDFAPPDKQRHSPSSPSQMRRHVSSQSSMESSESVPSTGWSKEDYAVMADVPKAKKVGQKESRGYVGLHECHQVARKQELFKPASHSLSKHPSREWEDAGDAEREWHCHGGGGLSRAHSSTSLQRSGSPTADEDCWRKSPRRSEPVQPDLLNFKKGWMSKLDDSGEWKKHWFVLTDAGLKYYRDSSAEEKDDLDGEIDLKSCVKVSEFDVEKNYGFQIQTREAVFTLSAMTAGIRRNWIEVLKKCIQPSSSPDLTQLPDSSSDKENSHTRFLRGPSSRQSEVAPFVPPPQHRFDYVELSPVPASSGPRPVGQREAAEGQGKEERTRDPGSSPRDAVLSRKATGTNPQLRLDDEIEKKWAEFERIPLREMSSMPTGGSRSSSQSANEALQREVASLRQQLEQFQQGGRGGGRGGGGARGSCGPEAPCGRSLVAMDRAHRQALEELQRQHERQMKELEVEKTRLLLEESRDTARVVEALKKKHSEDMEREVEKVRRLNSGAADSQSLRAQQQAETQALQRELAGLSERYSHKCLQLNRAEQNNAEREREISRKERDLDHLRKENLDLKMRLTEEMSRVRCSVPGQSSEGGKDSCELEVLLRMKENEIEYLHKEISCLRDELQFLNTEKRLACERYTEVHDELNGMKGRSEREIQRLTEHLKLAMAALHEGQKLGNSLDH